MVNQLGGCEAERARATDIHFDQGYLTKDWIRLVWAYLENTKLSASGGLTTLARATPRCATRTDVTD
jgi:hypothetical protein